MEYTPQNLEYAVSVFYNGEQSERARAHAWLTAAQRVPEAWKFVWELLQPNKGTEIQFYAATTLHTKILRCWNELPPESYEELKEKILQAVYAYSKGPKIVTNRLCISLAAFILQQGTQDLATILRPLSTPENTSLLLEVLTVIPEEYNSMTMGSSLRTKNRTALQQACPMVLDDMLRCLQTVYNDYSKEPPPEREVQAWSTAALCACSWLSLGGEDGDAGPLADRLPLCRALLAIVRLLFTWNDAVSDSALDACEACLSGVRAAAGGGSAARHAEAALQLAAELAALAGPILQRDNVPNSINEELLSALITCCVSIVECHSHTIVAAVERDPPHEGARQLVEILLAAQAAPGHYPLHETRSNLVFGTWYTLQDEVLNVMDGRSKIAAVWREVFSRLLTALVHKAEAHEAALCRDDLELLRCYRQDVADTVMYCYGILGDWCWSTVEASYTRAETDLRREAALHTFLALADAAPHQRAPDALVSMLQHAVRAAHDTQDKRTLNTALDCLGGYASWLSCSGGSRGAELGAQCVRAAGAALPRCPAPAALALRKLCADCSAPAAALAPHIVRAAQSPVGRSDTWVRRQLLGAAGAALSAAELDVATPLLQELATMLEEDMKAQALEPTKVSGVAECCAALVAALAARPELAAALFRTLLPTLPVFAHHHTLVEPLFALLKQTVSTLLDECMTLVSEIAQLTIAGFNTKPCAAGLDVVKLLVLILGNEWPDTGRLLNATVAATARTVAPDPSGSPDVIEGIFALLHTITKKKPQYLDWLEDLLPQLVDLGCQCVRLWEARAARAACGWLAALCAARPLALEPAAPHLTAAALRCIGQYTQGASACGWLAALCAARPLALEPAAPHLTAAALRCIGQYTQGASACGWLAALCAARPLALEPAAPHLTAAALRCIGQYTQGASACGWLAALCAARPLALEPAAPHLTAAALRCIGQYTQGASACGWLAALCAARPLALEPAAPHLTAAALRCIGQYTQGASACGWLAALCAARPLALEPAAPHLTAAALRCIGQYTQGASACGWLAALCAARPLALEPAAPHLTAAALRCIGQYTQGASACGWLAALCAARPLALEPAAPHLTAAALRCIGQYTQGASACGWLAALCAARPLALEPAAPHLTAAALRCIGQYTQGASACGWLAALCAARPLALEPAAPHLTAAALRCIGQYTQGASACGWLAALCAARPLALEPAAPHLTAAALRCIGQYTQGASACGWLAALCAARPLALEPAAPHLTAAALRCIGQYTQGASACGWLAALCAARPLALEPAAPHLTAAALRCIGQYTQGASACGWLAALCAARPLALEPAAPHLTAAALRCIGQYTQGASACGWLAALCAARPLALEPAAPHLTAAALRCIGQYTQGASACGWLAALCAARPLALEPAAPHLTAAALRCIGQYTQGASACGWLAALCAARPLALEPAAPHLTAAALRCIGQYTQGASACGWLAALCAARPLALEPAAPHLTAAALRCIGQYTQGASACGWLAALCAARPLALEPAAPHLTAAALRCIGQYTQGASACGWLAARPLALEPAAPHLTAAALRCIGQYTQGASACGWLAALCAARPLALEPAAPHLTAAALRCIGQYTQGASACGWLAALCVARPLALEPAAPHLTAAALRCIGGATPRNQIEPLAELLLALNRAAWRSPGAGDLAAWLRAALAAPGFPTHHATDTSKHKFIAAVIKEKSSKRRILETVQEFSLVCRGLIGTEYARQTLASKQLVA